MSRFKNVFRLAVVLLFIAATAQFGKAQDVLDVEGGFYKKVTTEEKEIIPYDEVREADVFWKKRIWRTIDTREKINLPFRYPKQPLIEIIHTAAMNGELVVYENLPSYGYDFLAVLPVDKVREIGNRTDTTTQIDPITLQEKQVIITNKLEWSTITKFRLKEDWFFDEETSTFQVRILALSPVREIMKDGVYIGDEGMYWIYYPDLRPILVKYEAYNPKNEAIRLSWDDIFESRLFSSYINMENNVLDRSILDYVTGIDALLENDRIKNELYNFENDLWTY